MAIFDGNENRKPYEELTFSNNFLFCKILTSNETLCKELIRIITGREVSEISPPRAEVTLKQTIGGKAVRFDVIFADDEKTVYDFEMQTTNDALPKRSRYYQGLLDTSALDQGIDYINLPKSLIVFICTFDPFGFGRHVYTFENRCVEDTIIALGDETCKVFLNTDGTTGEITEEMKNFLDYVAGRSVEGSFAESLQDEVKKALQNEEWRKEYMQNQAAWMDAKREGLAEGRAEGLQWIYELVESGDLSVERAAKQVNLTVEQFKNNMVLTGHKIP